MEYWTPLILGTVGSLHCAGMCGPLALALPTPSGGRLPYLAGRLSYNAGRIVTYGLLGLVFGLLGKTMLLAGMQRWLSVTLGVLVILGFFASGKFRLGLPIANLIGRLRLPLSALLRCRSATSQFALGLLNGLLPCGLVYVAGAGATATGDWLAAVQYMIVFGLGTFPTMLALSFSRNWLPVSVRLELAKAIPVGVFLLASLLILRGMSLGIPYLSPDLTASPGQSPVCHKPASIEREHR